MYDNVLLFKIFRLLSLCKQSEWLTTFAFAGKFAFNCIWTAVIYLVNWSVSYLLFILQGFEVVTRTDERQCIQFTSWNDKKYALKVINGNNTVFEVSEKNCWMQILFISIYTSNRDCEGVI